HLDVIERATLAPSGRVCRRERLDQLAARALEPVELGATRQQQPFDRELGCDGGVFRRRPRPLRREPLLDERREHVVDALPRNACEPRHVRRSRRVPPHEREIGLRLVARQPEVDQTLRAHLHARSVTTADGASRCPLVPYSAIRKATLYFVTDVRWPGVSPAGIAFSASSPRR